jgi:hypothetical protein
VQIVTDSDRFLRFYRLNWLKKDGNPVANYPLYKKILEAQKGLEVGILSLNILLIFQIL